MKYRKGDTVTLHGVIGHDSDSSEGTIAVDVDGHYQALWLEVKHIALDRPRFEVGDKVSWGVQSFGTIQAISAGYTWVEVASGNYLTIEIENLSRVELADVES